MANIERSVEYTQTRPDGTSVTKNIPYVNNDAPNTDIADFVTGVSALSKNTLTDIVDVHKQGVDLLANVNTEPNITLKMKTTATYLNYAPNNELEISADNTTLKSYADKCKISAGTISRKNFHVQNYGSNCRIDNVFLVRDGFYLDDYGDQNLIRMRNISAYHENNVFSAVTKMYGNNCQYESCQDSNGKTTVLPGIQNTTLSVYGNDCTVDIRGTHHDNKTLIEGKRCSFTTICYIDPTNTDNPPKTTITIGGGAQNTKIALSNSTEYQSNVDIYNLTDDTVILRNLPNTIAADAPARTWNHELINDNADTRITLGYDSNESPLAVLTLYGRTDGVVKIIESDSWSDTDYLKTYTIA